MKLEDYISEAISHGRNRRYIESSEIPNLETILEKDMVSLLENLTFINFKMMNPGKDYGYSTSRLINNSDIRYLFNYIYSNFDRGDIVWYWFKDSNNIAIVVLDDIRVGNDNAKAAIFVIKFLDRARTNGRLSWLSTFLGKETNTAIGTKTIYLERAKTDFDGSMKALKDTLSKYE